MSKKTNEDKTGVKSVEGNTMTISDPDKFNKHLKKVTDEITGSTTILKIMDVSLNPIHLACDDDELRPNCRLIEIKNNIASATNGSMLVKIDLSQVSPFSPDQLKILNGKYIDMEVWREMHKCDALELDDHQIICNKKGINKIFEYSYPQGEFFRMDNIILDIKEAGEEAKRVMGFNPKLISTLGSIFHSADSLIFSFTKGNQGTLVYPVEGCGMFAVLMPVAIEEGQNRYFFI
jgi:hypothetical protein